MSVAKWLCIVLIVLGGLLVVADVLDWLLVAQRSMPFYLWTVWKWGLSCVMVGVSGAVILEAAEKTTAGRQSISLSGMQVARAAVVLASVVYFVLLILAVSFPGLRLQWFQRDAHSIRISVLALAVLLATAFWRHVSTFITSRNIVVGKDRLELTALQNIPSALSGTVRDNFIFIGNFHLWNRRYRAAFEHYASAHRIKKSIHTAFRCMQCLAALCQNPEMARQAAPVIQDYFQDALWLADGPRDELAGRMDLVEWFRQRRALVLATDDQLVLDLQAKLKEDLGGRAIAPSSDW